MEIESDKAPPVFFNEQPVKKTRKKAEPKPVDMVLENLKLLGLVAKKNGTVQNTHIMIKDEFAKVCSDELSIGCPMPFSANAVVSYHDLLEAKKVAGTEFACTTLQGQLVVVAGDVRMVVNADHSGVWACPAPDVQIAPATDSLRTALSAVVPFATVTDRPNIQGVLCQGMTAVATNGYALIEAFHGVDMPPNLRLPVVFVKKLEKIKRKIIGFGFSEYSFTVWFEDGAYIRTAMYAGNYAEYMQVFDEQPGELVDLPDEFYKTLKAIQAFAKDDVVYFKDGRIYTSRDSESASSFHHPGIPNGFGFNIKYLLLIAPHAPTVKFMNSGEGVQFECGNVRGSVMGLDTRPQPKIAEPIIDENYYDAFDDDVPY